MVVRGAADLQLRDRTVLGVLVVRAGTAVTTDELGDALWGDGPPASYRKIIQSSVVRLRRRLGPEAISTTSGGYRLDLGRDEVDAHCFAAKIASARSLLDDGYAARAMFQVGEALALWRGAPLPELEDWPPAEAEARRLRVLYAAERQADALTALTRLREMLRDEIGVDPSPDLVALELAILKQDSALAVLPGVRPGSKCPWPGLLAYEVTDADAFFGRDREIAECLARLERQGVLVVVGASGCGKSSMVRAGLVPRLSGSQRLVQVVAPGPHPLAALTGVPSDAVLIVDQAEEAVTQCLDDEERSAFFDRIAARAAPVVVVARADRLDDLTRYGGFAMLLERGLFVVPPMDELGRRAVIERPAALAQVQLEPGLTEVLIRDCGDEPGALPLLSHALAETWRNVEGNTLTVASYRSCGGMQGAIATTAEHVYRELDPSQQRMMRLLFLRLVGNAGGDVVRMRAARASVPDDGLVERLLTARLLSVTDDGDLQLAHEALVRHWPRLGDWLSEDHSGQRILHHLSAEAREWESQGRPDGSLYRGLRLEGALAWIAEHEDGATTLERQFVEASRVAVEGELARAQLRAEQTHVLLVGQRRRNRQLRLTLAVAAVLLVGTAIAAVMAVHQRSEAQRANDAATAARDVSEASRIGTLAESADEPSVAFSLAAEALTMDDSEPSRISALNAFGHFASLIAATENPGPAPAGCPACTLGWQGGELAAHTAHETVLLDPGTLDVLGTTSNTGDAGSGTSHAGTWVGPTSGGDRAFVLNEEGTAIEVVEIATDTVVSTWRAPKLKSPMSVATGTVALAPDGSELAVALDHSVLFLDTSLEVVATTSGTPTTPTGLEFDPTGRLMAAGLSEEGFVEAGTTVVWNVATGLEVHRVKSGSGAVWSHVFSPDSTRVYSAGSDGIRSWDLTGAHALVRTPDGDPTLFRAGDIVLLMGDRSVDAWITEACRLAGRPLTEDEWKEFIGDRPYRPVCAT